jgi:hypothetical protein
MLAAFSNPRGQEPRDPGSPAAGTDTIAIDAETRALIDDAAEPRWSKFLRYWQRLAAEKGRYPARSEIDPLEIGPDLLPNIFLADVVTKPGSAAMRFRYRLLGQAILDRETTRPGNYLDELGAAADIEAIERHYRACLKGEVSLRRASLVWNDIRKDVFTYSVLLLPLTDEAGSIAHLIGLVLYRF